MLSARALGSFLLLSAVLPAGAQKQLTQASAAARYKELATKVRSGDLNIDWREFRLDAALGEVSQGFDSQPVHVQVVDDLDAGRYEKALAESQTVIDHNMAFGEGHLLAMTVLQKMGKVDEASKEEAILNAIGKSIMDSGDGSSAATAWFTVMPSETVFFLTEALGAEITDHELVRVNGHAYNKLTVLDRQKKKRVVWFNTDTNELLKERALHPESTQ